MGIYSFFNTLIIATVVGVLHATCHEYRTTNNIQAKDKAMVMDKIANLYGDETKTVMAISNNLFKPENEKYVKLLKNLIKFDEEFKQLCEIFSENLGSNPLDKFLMDCWDVAEKIRQEKPELLSTTWRVVREELVPAAKRKFTEDLLPAMRRKSSTEFLSDGLHFTVVWATLPDETKEKIVTHTLQWAYEFPSKAPGKITDSYTSLLKSVVDAQNALKNYNIHVPIPILAYHASGLTFNTYTSLNRWYVGKISGKRASKEVIDEAGAFTGGIVGATLGAALGRYAEYKMTFCPGCEIMGVSIGMYLGRSMGSDAIDKLTGAIFDLPKDVAVEKAYNYLGIHHKASDEEVREAFKKQYHKFKFNKGGLTEESHKLQLYMGIIVVHRKHNGQLKNL